MPMDKCTFNPGNECLGLQKANMLEKSLNSHLDAARQTHKAVSYTHLKTTGFPAYDFTRAFAIAVLSLDSDIAVAEEKLDLENLSGTELDTFIRQHRGLSRKYATYATATLRVVTGGGDIQAGNLFSTASGVEFYAIQDGTYTAGDTFSVRAYVGGESGNVGPRCV